ncbi:MAG: ABC transporter ATP-binding protein [Gemmatimonadota bacterium]|nr:ABC transporter ATP-binding protein [Gemmatimonadota bacterium]
MSDRVIVRDLRKHYGGVEAARGVSFEIRPGEIFGLLGPNGAGKTTTLECVVGLREPDEGEIEVCGIDARREPRAVKEKIGAALQTTSLQDRITPREALALFASFYRHPAAPAELLERFSLSAKADAPFETLSGGQRQRLALALAFVNRPEVVFLDEPTVGLDPHSRRELHGEIARMRAEGHTVLLTTHYLDEAEQLCDRVAVVDQGRIVATGAPHELVARSRATPCVSLTTSQPLDVELLAGLPEVREPVCEGTLARFGTASVNRTVAELLRVLSARGVEVTELHVRKATLEDVFVELTGSRLRD